MTIVSSYNASSYYPLFTYLYVDVGKVYSPKIIPRILRYKILFYHSCVPAYLMYVYVRVGVGPRYSLGTYKV